MVLLMLDCAGNCQGSGWANLQEIQFIIVDRVLEKTIEETVATV